MATKTSTLFFRANISEDTQNIMREVRKNFVELSYALECLGDSREMDLAFTHLEEALSYAIKHLALTDKEAILEEIYTTKQ